MTISIRQMRAARGLLGWSQAELSARANVSKNTICDVERGKIMPRLQTLLKLRAIFEEDGVEFLTADGTQMRQDVFKVYSLEGENIFMRHFQDQIDVMRKTGGIACHHSDDAAFSLEYPEEFFWYYSQMLKYNLKEHLLVPDGQPFRYAPHKTTECRTSMRDVLGFYGYSVYGDKFSLYLPGRIAIIENKTIADTYRKQFESDWKRARPLPPIPALFDKELKKRGLI